MKKFIFIFLFGCSLNPIVNVSTANVFSTINQSGFIRASIVAGFEHQYDSCQLIITNYNDTSQLYYNNVVPVFNNIALSVGNYGFYIHTPDPDTISHYLNFTASNNDIEIVKGTNDIQLLQDSKQALILVNGAGLDSFPTIYAGNKIGVMSQYQGYYYSYVLGNCVIEFMEGGIKKQRPIDTRKEEIFLYDPATGNINVIDSFKKLNRV